jgi:hypothetical protein
MAVGAAIAASCISPPAANADMYDPHIPIPLLSWCPGGGIGTGLGGYCEGASYPDGTRWNIAYGWAPFVGRIQQPMRCIVFTGDPNPPLAGPGGCGGAV